MFQITSSMYKAKEGARNDRAYELLIDIRDLPLIQRLATKIGFYFSPFTKVADVKKINKDLISILSLRSE